MKIYEQVETYMSRIGLKYIKNANDFAAGLAYKTKDKKYTMDLLGVLNARAEGSPTDNTEFYKLKNQYFEGSLYVSAAFDGGVFRHIGNMIIDNAEILKGEVLDIACDCGVVTCFMALMNPESHFIGIDINEAAIINAKQLAEKLEISNVEFKCADVFELELGREFDAVTAFRTLLDVCDSSASFLSTVGLRKERENAFAGAFADYAKKLSQHLKTGGYALCVERYTAEYGWLGWLQALNEQGINAIDGCELMRAQDISSVKEYSVTFAKKASTEKSFLDVFNDYMSKGFKTGSGYDGSMAEFALYYDADGEIEFTDVLKNDRVIHQFAFAKAKSGKTMSFDAGKDSRKIKYLNDKKAAAAKEDLNKKLSLYSQDEYTTNCYTIKI